MKDIPAGGALRTSHFRSLPRNLIGHRHHKPGKDNRHLRLLASLDGTLASGGGRSWLAAYVKPKRPPPTLDGEPMALARDETIVLIPLKGGQR